MGGGIKFLEIGEFLGIGELVDEGEKKKKRKGGLCFSAPVVK